MLTSALYRGLVYTGTTKLACTIRVEQTAPLALTVRAGLFTHPNGTVYRLPADVAIPVLPGHRYAVWLAADGDSPDAVVVIGAWGPGERDVLTLARTITLLTPLVLAFTVPTDATALDALEINVFDVADGFPPGETGGPQTGHVEIPKEAPCP
jgi:hypothetical protein